MFLPAAVRCRGTVFVRGCCFVNDNVYLFRGRSVCRRSARSVAAATGAGALPVGFLGGGASASWWVSLAVAVASLGPWACGSVPVRAVSPGQASLVSLKDFRPR